MGGVVAHVSDLARLIQDAGHSVTIATPHADPHPANLDGDAAPTLISLGSLVYRGKLLSRDQIKAFMSMANKSDMVHLHETWDPRAVQLASHLRKAGIPYAATPHGMLDEWCMAHHPGRKKAFLSLFGKRYFAGAAATLFCAQGELDQAGWHIDTSKGHVVPAATDLTDFQELPGPEIARTTVAGCAGEAPVVLFLSRIERKKGLEVLVDAMPLVLKKHPSAQLVVAGPGEPNYVDGIKQRINDHGIETNTHLIGLIRGAAKVSLYERASMLALPTQQENFGLVLTECLAAKTPIITTKAVDIWPELQACNGGCLIGRTPSAFADAICTLIEDPTRAQRMGESGRSWVMTALSSENLSKQFLGIYGSVVGSNRSI